MGGVLFFESRGRSRAARWGRRLILSVVLIGVAVGFDAVLIEPHIVLTVSRYELPAGRDGRLAAALSGATVVHLSDLHVRRYGIRERLVARRLAKLAPDLILMTGDYGEGPDGPAALTRLLSTVKPRYGIYGVMGNNDYYRGQSEEILAALRKAGVRVLINGSEVLRAPGGDVVIAGVDDPHYGRDAITEAMAGVGDDLPVILLSHSPELLARKERALMMNAGDAEGPWGRGWWWQDGSHVRSDPGEVSFPSSGTRRMRIQRREDGVAVAEIRLVPESVPMRKATRQGGAPEHVPGEIIIKASDVAEEDLHGGWERRDADGALVELPDRGVNQTFAEADPASYFEAVFEAVGGVRYHVWVHLESANGRGTSDSLYVQFSDSLNPAGAPDYRIGVTAPGVETNRVDLMLAGHTHDGQVQLPWLGPVEPNIRRAVYRHGRYQVGPMTLVLSRGVGWSYLPFRFLCPPEIVLLDESREGEHAGTF